MTYIKTSDNERMKTKFYFKASLDMLNKCAINILKYYDKIICYCDEAWWSAEDNNFFNEKLKNLELYNEFKKFYNKR